MHMHVTSSATAAARRWRLCSSVRSSSATPCAPARCPASPMVLRRPPCAPRQRHLQRPCGRVRPRLLQLQDAATAYPAPASAPALLAARFDTNASPAGLQGLGPWPPAPLLPVHPGAHVSIYGLGRSGVQAARLALHLGAQVTGYDDNPAVQPLEQCPELMSHAPAAAICNSSTSRGSGGGGDARPKLATVAGADAVSAASAADLGDLLVVSPGVAPSAPLVQRALAGGVPVVSELDFACRLLPHWLPMVCVTGTNGKSTTATFVGQLLRPCGCDPWVGGNLGTPLSDLALRMRQGERYDFAVVEVSSYQLQLPPSRALRPLAAAVTTLTPDHLERHGSMRAYAAAKVALTAHMGPQEVALVPAGEPLLQEAFAAGGSRASLLHLGGDPGVQVLPASAATGCRALLHLPRLQGLLRNQQDQQEQEQPQRWELDLSVLRCAGQHNAWNAATAAALVLFAAAHPGVAAGARPEAVAAGCADGAPGAEFEPWALDAWVDGAAGAGASGAGGGEEAAGRHEQWRQWRAALAERAFRVTPEAVQAALPLLQPPPHRMEVVVDAGGGSGGAGGVMWINDSKATNLEASEAGISGLDRLAVVLLGGRAKQQQQGRGQEEGPGPDPGPGRSPALGFGQLAPSLARHRAVVCYGECGAQAAQELRAAGLAVEVEVVGDLQAAVRRAAALAHPGDAVLLSPACASFDQFRNYEHRGEVFRQVARSLCREQQQREEEQEGDVQQQPLPA